MQNTQECTFQGSKAAEDWVDGEPAAASGDAADDERRSEHPRIQLRSQVNARRNQARSQQVQAHLCRHGSSALMLTICSVLDSRSCLTVLVKNGKWRRCCLRMHSDDACVILLHAASHVVGGAL